jgi:hypothetical protein
VTHTGHELAREDMSELARRTVEWRPGIETELTIRAPREWPHYQRSSVSLGHWFQDFPFTETKVHRCSSPCIKWSCIACSLHTSSGTYKLSPDYCLGSKWQAKEVSMFSTEAIFFWNFICGAEMEMKPRSSHLLHKYPRLS